MFAKHTSITAPAQEVVEYEVREFTAGFNKHNTMYMNNGSEPTDELDHRWKELWEGKSCHTLNILTH